MKYGFQEFMKLFRASPVFMVAVLATLALAGVNGVMVLVMQLQPGFLGMAHFTKLSHRVHDLTYGFLFGTAVVGMLTQLRRPSKDAAAMLMALIPWGGLLLAAVLSTDARVILSTDRAPAAMVTIIAALLHPAGRRFFRSFRLSRVNWVMLALVVLAAVPLLIFASTNIELQRTITDDHADLGHYGFMAAIGFTVIGVAFLASLRPDGWRLTAWVAGFLLALLGGTSTIYPDVSSSLSPVLAFAAIAWGVGFIAAAELTKNMTFRAPSGSKAMQLDVDTRVKSADESITSTPRWKNALGAVGIVGALLPVILFIAGALGGGVGHRPPSGTDSHGEASPVGDGAVKIVVTADNFSFNPDKIMVRTGDNVAITLTSVDALHDFTIDELDAHVAADQGETATGGLRAERPGRYTFYCAVPGHRQAGMEGTLLAEDR